MDPKDLLHIGDVVRHRGSGLVGKVDGFAHDGTVDVMVGGTGPYPQEDFERLVQEGKADGDSDSCSCTSFSSCTHK